MSDVTMCKPVGGIVAYDALTHAARPVSVSFGSMDGEPFVGLDDGAGGALRMGFEMARELARLLRRAADKAEAAR